VSHAATKWAFDQPELFPDMKPGETLVLVYLADCHNPIHGCYPSQDYLARRANLTDRSVRENLGRLRTRGLVNWDETRREGHRGFNRYYLGFEPGFVPAARPEGGRGSAAGEQPDYAGELPEESSGSQPEDRDTGNRKNPARATGSLAQHSYEQVRVEPVTPNGERARASEGWGDHAARDAEHVRDHEQLKADFEKLKAIWPDIALESQTLAADALSGLTPSERKEAIERVPDFIAFHREKRGKRPLPYLSTYLKEKRWTEVPKRRAASAAEVPKKFVAAFDSAWFWLFVEAVKKFDDKLKDRHSAESLFLRKRHGLARSSGIGWPVEAARLPEVEEGARTYVQIAVEGADFQAWASWFRQRGAELPRPDVAPFIWLPSRKPPEERDPREVDAEERERAEEGNRGDDDVDRYDDHD
jgi:hypothetical protein